MSNDFHPQTRAALAGIATDTNHGSVTPPLHLTSTFAWRKADEKPQYSYSRSENPTRDNLAQALAELEGAAGGVITSTGISAIDLVFCLLETGDRVLAPTNCYGGVHRLLSARAAKGHFAVDFVDQTDDDAFAAALAKKPKIVWLETPSNPLLQIVDIEKAAKAAHQIGALVAVDNTFMSPVLQNPIALGCDIVVHSITKLINGHSDVVGGAALAKDPEIHDKLVWWANCTGVSGAPFDSYLALRGLRTLYTRITAQQATAGTVAQVLDADPRVTKVHYPGLASHPGYDIAKRQQRGAGTMVSLELADGVDPVVFVESLRLFSLAESLGGFESLVCLPSRMTHASMPPEARATAGIADSLIRLSLGLEHDEDIVADINAALTAASDAGQGVTRLDTQRKHAHAG